MTVVHGILVAVQFLTRVPVDVQVRDDADMAAAVPWFPFVGGLLGLLVGSVAAVLLGPLGALPACVVGVAVGVVATGALHEDGLGDVADGFWGGWEPQRRLTIMRDSRLGTYGVLAVGLALLLRVSLLAELAVENGRGGLLAAAVLGHVVSRSGALLLMATQPLARPDGVGAAYLSHLEPRRALVGAVASTALAAMVLGPVAPVGTLAAVFAAALTSALVAVLARRKVGGITGDVLGAAQQLVELAVLAALAATPA